MLFSPKTKTYWGILAKCHENYSNINLKSGAKIQSLIVFVCSLYLFTFKLANLGAKI